MSKKIEKMVSRWNRMYVLQGNIVHTKEAKLKGLSVYKAVQF